jgi:hypothetical protein
MSAPSWGGRDNGCQDEQERFEPAACCLQVFSDDRLGAGSVTECFVFNHRHKHGGKIAGAQRAHQLDRVTPIRLDAITWLTWDKRWCTDHAVEAFIDQPSIQALSARACFIDKADVLRLWPQPLAQPVDVNAHRADLGKQFHFAHPDRIGDRKPGLRRIDRAGAAPIQHGGPRKPARYQQKGGQESPQAANPVCEGVHEATRQEFRTPGQLDSTNARATTLKRGGVRAGQQIRANRLGDRCAHTTFNAGAAAMPA